MPSMRPRRSAFVGRSYRRKPLPRRIRPPPPWLTESSNQIHPLRIVPTEPSTPTALRLPHPAANHYWDGLFKYTTGKIIAPDHVTTALGYEDIALKVYSEQSLSLRPGHILDALPSPSRPQMLDSLGAYLNFTHVLTEGLFSLANSARAIWFQAFSHSTRLPGRSPQDRMRDRVRRGFIPTWALAVQLYRANLRAPLSKPLVRLDAYSSRFEVWCYIREGMRLARPGRFTMSIGGHLDVKTLYPEAVRTDEAQVNSGDLHLHHPVDAVLRDMFNALKASVVGRTFDSRNAMLLGLKTALLEHLPNSHLATALDFVQFELVLEEGNLGSGERVVGNTFLNSDGSERPQPEKHQIPIAQQSTSERITPGSTDSHRIAIEDTGRIAITLEERTKLLPLSQQTRETVGLPDFSVRVYLNKKQDDLKSRVGSREVIAAFERACQTQARSGIARYAAAANKLSLWFPAVQERLFLSSRELEERLGIVNNRRSILELVVNDSNFPVSLGTWVDVHLPEMTGFQFTLASPSHPTVRAKTIRVFIMVTDTERSGEGNHPELAPAVPFEQEYTMIYDQGIAILRRLSDELTFDTWESVPQLIAESILHFATFKDPSLVAWGAKVSVVPDEAQDLPTASATATNRAVLPSVNIQQRQPSEDEDGQLPVTQQQEPEYSRNEDLRRSGQADASDGCHHGVDKQEGTDFARGSSVPQRSDVANMAADIGSKILRAKAGFEKFIFNSKPIPEVHNVAIKAQERMKNHPLASNKGGIAAFVNAVGAFGDTSAGVRKVSARLYHRHTRSEGGVFVALGSNMGNRLKHIEDACNMIDADPDMKILRTSALYETDPMYVEDQERFVNGVCEIDTSLPPMELLDHLQAIEQALGRVKIVEKGPRNIDLDILIYRNIRMNEDRLTIPHPLMLEREFVLRPLCDLQTARDKTISPAGPTMGHCLLKIAPQLQEIFAQTQLGPHTDSLQLDHPRRHTQIMAILNTTPDSFSDGGTNNSADRDRLRSTIESFTGAGATIIDIGGQSSRPNAPDVSADEEIARILPALEAIKSSPQAAKVVISVDTYRAAVAEAAIKAGAHVVNDISAGQLDPEMLPTVARLGCTYVMMHMRGTPSTMQSEENCSYPDGLIETISKELLSRIDAAQDAGIRRWRIILDPGIGFSKTQDQNLEILRSLPELKRRINQFPWLVGSSRKSFIGKITGVDEPKHRGWGTAATVTAAVQGGADIVRVHDVEEMAAVVKMADAMYRV